MKKSITTRIRITKNKKGIQRKMAQCHFRAKKTSVQQGRKANTYSMHSSTMKRVLKKPGTL